MNALMQGVIVALAICGALAYLGWRAWRKVVAARGRGGDCGADGGTDCGCGTH